MLRECCEETAFVEFKLYFASGTVDVHVKCRDQYVCMCVCYYVCLFLQYSPNFICVLPESVAWFSSDGNAMRHLLPVLRIMSCL